MAPHTQEEVINEDWNRPYSRHQAAFPAVRYCAKITLLQ